MAPTSRSVRQPVPGGDEADLFRTHHRRLLQLVARDVSARPQVIEDACAFAWLELVARQPARTNILGWLRVVARREAIRLARYDRRLAALTPRDHDRRAAHAHRSRLEAREALGLVAALPPRKRAVLAPQVSGHSYREMAAGLQISERTVERQVLRARAAVRRAHAPAADVRSAA
jgi:RNA polymerase sigma factor (sigma-70 family)